MPAVVPQDCRVARVRCSRALHAPGPAGATRGPSVSAGLRAGLLVQGLSVAVTRRGAHWLPGGRAGRTSWTCRACGCAGLRPEGSCRERFWGRRTVARRRRWHHTRLPGRRAARLARGHGVERPPSWHTPEPRRDVRYSQETLSRGERLLNRVPAAHRAVAAPPGLASSTCRARGELRRFKGRSGPPASFGP
jgi:hypothetical protein